MYNKFFNLKNVALIVACFAASFLFSGCGGNGNTATPLPPLSDTDYSNCSNWLSFGGDNSKDVDIFVIYPTVTFSEDEADMPYVRLESVFMREQAAKWLIQVDDVISEYANIYAPLYRQLNATMLSDLTNEEFASHTNATPREDAFAAFDYYLKNVNKGTRPFILFGHSQGAQLVMEIATTFLGNANYSEYNKNHIISYVIGVSVTQEGLNKNPNLRFSTSKDDTGVIVSWNSTAPSEIESETYKNFGTWNQNALVTNPISWTTDETPALATENKKSAVEAGETLFSPMAMMEHYAGATVHPSRGVLEVTDVDESMYPALLPNLSKYHGSDILFFYESIQQNIKDRIEAFKNLKY